MRTLFATALSILTLSSAVRAEEHWVDPVNGDDANGGTSETDAWKTLTRALVGIGDVADGADTVFLLPGTYDTISGEQFPLELRADLTILGLEGPFQTRVEGVSAEDVFRFTSNLPQRTTLRGLNIRGGVTGVSLRASLPGLDFCLEESVVRGNEDGLTTETAFSGGIVSLKVDSSVFRNNDFAARFQGSALVDISDSRFVNNFAGVEVQGTGAAFGSSLDLELERCEVRNSGTGVRFSSTGSNAAVRASLRDCLIVENGQAGVRFTEFGGTLESTLTRCTVAGNGFGFLGIFPQISPIVLQDSIVSANDTDISLEQASIQNENSLVGPGEYFVDAAAGDYRLRAGSLAVAPAGSLDQQGRARDVDGDGDTVGAPDLGALELITLESVQRSVAPGDVIDLELFGQAGATSTLFFRRGATGTGSATPFGTDFLGAGARVFGVFTILAGPEPTAISFPIPNIPQASGQTVSFQALSFSSQAPQGQAFTTPVSVLIQ